MNDTLIAELRELTIDELSAVCTKAKEIAAKKHASLHEASVRSSHVRGAVGTQLTKVTKWVLDNVDPARSVLDYGAGLYRTQTMFLRGFDYKNVRPHDLLANMKHWPDEDRQLILFEGFDVVMLSNVINVQPSREDVLIVLRDALYRAFPTGGVVVFNYPGSPRYAGLTKREVLAIAAKACETYGYKVERDTTYDVVVLRREGTVINHG